MALMLLMMMMTIVSCPAGLATWAQFAPTSVCSPNSVTTLQWSSQLWWIWATDNWQQDTAIETDTDIDTDTDADTDTDITGSTDITYITDITEKTIELLSNAQRGKELGEEKEIICDIWIF